MICFKNWKIIETIYKNDIILKYQKCNQYYLIKIKLVFLININFNLVFQSMEKLYYWTGKVSKGHSIINNMIKRKKEILH